MVQFALVPTVPRFSLLFVLVTLSIPLLADGQTYTPAFGFNLDSCNTTSQCSYPRKCIYLRNAKLATLRLCPPQPHFLICYCLNPLPRQCKHQNGTEIDTTTATSTLTNSTAPTRFCPAGEICARQKTRGTTAQKKPSCLSCNEVANHPRNYAPALPSSLGNTSQAPVQELCPTPPGDGLVLSTCRDDLHCKPPRRCQDRKEASSSLYAPCLRNSTECVCITTFMESCDGCSHCPAGEACVRRVGTRVTFCMSAAVSARDDRYVPFACNLTESATGATASGLPRPTASAAATAAVSLSPSPHRSSHLAAGALSLSPLPSPPPVGARAACVDAAALAHLERDAVVFRRDAWAQVLCDAGGSCATDDHIVVFRGAAMSMRTYCRGSRQRCRREWRWVNSPRLLRRGVRVGSATADLTYTALAGRFGSRLEERALCTLVRIGF